MTKLARRAGLAALLLALSISCQAAAEGVPLDGKPALDFAIEEMSFGNETSLSDFDGRVVLLEFWFLG